MQILNEKYEDKKPWKVKMRSLEIGGGCLVAPVEKSASIRAMATAIKGKGSEKLFSVKKEDGVLKIWRVA